MANLGNNMVSMSNLAARSAHGFGLVEKRIFAAGLSQLPPCLERSTLTLAQRTVRLTALDYAETYGVDTKLAYGDLRTAADSLFERHLRYSVLTPTGLKERKLRWMGGVTYHHGEGWVEWSFTEEITPHLFELRKQFTEYRLRQAAALRSVYSWRLLELLQSSRPESEKNQGFLTIDLATFRHALEIPKTYAYKNIRQRVIDPAVNELRNKDGWLIQWQTIKNGRTVEKLTFRWERNPQSQFDLPAPDEPKTAKPPRSDRGQALPRPTATT
jgi:plasmid replication initiation protein